jgi:hypothetical protein
VILPPNPESATLRIRTLADSLAVAVEAGDHDSALSLVRSLRACADGLARELTAEVFDLQPHDDHRAEIHLQLFDVRQRRQHLLGSPRDFARLSADETRLLRELAALDTRGVA